LADLIPGLPIETGAFLLGTVHLHPERQWQLLLMSCLLEVGCVQFEWCSSTGRHVEF
jgi:hypothetical protein